MNRLTIVVPCYKEEQVLPDTTKKLKQVLNDMIKEELIAADSFILFVNDGSDDDTWTLIEQYHQESNYVCGLNLAANVGHQNALLAGLEVAVASADAIITIDADLQDDVNAIREMVIKYNEGCDIVYGVRKSRTSDTWFKRTTAQTFYKMMHSMGVRTVYNHADFRLMSKRAVLQLLCYRERNVYLRGIVPLLGYRTAEVCYDRQKRMAGESNYPLKKMLHFAFDGVTSFSVKPVHFVFYLGIFFLVIALGILTWALWVYLKGETVPGWSSLILSLWFCSGCVLIGIGVIGEYVGKIYMEVKDRPRYNIEKILMH